MTTRVDDFAVGRWYAITREPEVQEEFNPFFQRRHSTNAGNSAASWLTDRRALCQLGAVCAAAAV